MMARGSFTGQRSLTRPKRRLYEEISLDFLTQSYSAKEKATDIAPAFTRSNMALAVSSAASLVAYGANIPRYDYDKAPSPLGLLIEPGVTNRLYVPQGTAPSPNNMTAGGTVDGPGGANNATRFLEMANAAHHRFTMSYTIANPAANTITSSVVIRPLNRNYFYIRYAAGPLTYNIGFVFTPATNTMVCNYQVPGVTIGRVRYMGNGYWMLSATIINPSGSMNSMYFGSNIGAVSGDQLVDVQFTGVITSGFDYYWANICDGIIPVMPWNVATTGADAFTLPLSLENASRFMLNLEFITQDMTYGDSAVKPGLFKVSAGSGFSIGAYVRATDMNVVVEVTNSGGTVLFTASAPVTGLTTNRVAIGVDGKGVTVALNGTVIGSGNLAEYLPKMTTLALGRYEQTLYGWLRKSKIRTTPFSISDIVRATA